MRFSRIQRLSGAERYRTLLRSPAIARRTLVEGFARRNRVGFARLGIVIGRKVVARAVERNRYKRWVREQFRVMQRQLGGLDVVVRFRVHSERRTTDIRPEIIEILMAIARCRDSLPA